MEIENKSVHVFFEDLEQGEVFESDTFHMKIKENKRGDNAVRLLDGELVNVGDRFRVKRIKGKLVVEEL